MKFWWTAIALRAAEVIPLRRCKIFALSKRTAEIKGEDTTISRKFVLSC